MKMRMLKICEGIKLGSALHILRHYIDLPIMPKLCIIGEFARVHCRGMRSRVPEL